MPRAVKFSSGWSAGEWSPHLYTRFDLAQHSRSLRRCLNYIVTPEGALIRRPPTRFLGTTKFPSADVVLLEFTPSTSASFVVEAGHRYMRFWTRNGIVRDGSNNIIELSTPYTAAQLAGLATAQDADVLYIVHPDHLPYKLRRTSTAPTFDLVPVSFANGRAPLDTMNTSTTTIAASGTWPNVTLTASSSLFISADVGRAVYLRDVGNKRGAYLRIDTVTSSTVAQATGLFQAGDTSGLPAATTQWAFGLFSATRGCRAVTFHEGRLWYGGFASAPDVLVGSVSNAFDNFETISPDPTVNDAANADKAITRRAGAGTVEAIQWLLSGSDALLVGTAGAEFVVRPGVAGFLTPTEAAVRRATGRGSEPTVRALRIDSQVFFVQRGGQRLRRVKFDLEQDSFVTEDASILFSHLLQSGVRRIAYQQAPWSVIWLTDARDRLFGVTIEGQQDVVGAHRHALGGGYQGRNARVRDVACVPDSGTGGGRADLLFMAVQRTINGASVGRIEVLEPPSVVTDRSQPAERRIYVAERTAYVDSYQNLGETWAIVGGGDVGGVLRFMVSGSPPLAGTSVVLRGLVWRAGQEIISRTALVREHVIVKATGPDWFTVCLASDETQAVVTPAAAGLPEGVQLAPDVDELSARADRVVNTVSFPAQEPGDNYVVVADGRVETSSSLSSPASIVIGGFRYRSEFETNLLGLQGTVPVDTGEPTRVSHPTLWLWGGIDAYVRAGAAPPQRLVTATTSDMMMALPPPVFGPVTVHIDSDVGLDATLVVYTDGPHVCDVLGMAYVLRSNPR